MGYYKNYDNGRRGDYGMGNRGGYYGDRNFDDRNRMSKCPYEINQPVKHIATGIKLSVIRIGREQIECRKPDLSSEWFYDYELEPIGENNN